MSQGVLTQDKILSFSPLRSQEEEAAVQQVTFPTEKDKRGLSKGLLAEKKRFSTSHPNFNKPPRNARKGEPIQQFYIPVISKIRNRLPVKSAGLPLFILSQLWFLTFNRWEAHVECMYMQARIPPPIEACTEELDDKMVAFNEVSVAFLDTCLISHVHANTNNTSLISGTLPPRRLQFTLREQ